MNLDKLRNILLKLSDIFKKNNAHAHANTLMYFYNKSFEYEEKNYDPNFTREINGLYGGMGSFFDIGFAKDGIPLKDENIELSKYKNQLYEEWINLRTQELTKKTTENK